MDVICWRNNTKLKDLPLGVVGPVVAPVVCVGSLGSGVGNPSPEQPTQMAKNGSFWLLISMLAVPSPFTVTWVAQLSMMLQ